MKLGSKVVRIVGAEFAFAALLAVDRRLVVGGRMLVEEAVAVEEMELVEVAFVVVEVGFAVRTPPGFADSTLLLVAAAHTSSSFAYQQAPDTVPEAAVDSSAVEKYRIHPSVAHHQYSSSPSHLLSQDQAQMVSWDTYPNAAARHTDSNYTPSPSSLPTYDHSTAQP